MKCISCGFEYTYEEDGLVVCAMSVQVESNELKRVMKSVSRCLWNTTRRW